MDIKTIVIYHRADFDGIFCREIARKFLPEAELIGWHYGDPVEDIKNGINDVDLVYMLDISIDELMNHPNLIWIDHHKSAMLKFDSEHGGVYDISGYRIDGVAACRLAWQWFTINSVPQDQEPPSKEKFIEREVDEPIAVRLAGEYDIWDKRDPRADLLQHGLRSCDLQNYWPSLLDGNNRIVNESVDELLLRGEAIQYDQTELNKDIITSYGFDLEFEGLKFLACNHARYNSHLFTAGLKPHHDACFGFKWTGKDWEVSLYHAPGKEHHDLSLIAVKHGGGGHRGACGFRMNQLPFLK